MTTASKVQALPRQPYNPRSLIELEAVVEETKADQSTIASLLPAASSFLSFPSGTALEAVKKGSSTVRIRSTYVDDTLRIARPMLTLDGVDTEAGIFIYSREDALR